MHNQSQIRRNRFATLAALVASNMREDEVAFVEERNNFYRKIAGVASEVNIEGKLRTAFVTTVTDGQATIPLTAGQTNGLFYLIFVGGTLMTALSPNAYTWDANQISINVTARDWITAGTCMIMVFEA
jgi:hypothetical protein